MVLETQSVRALKSLSMRLFLSFILFSLAILVLRLRYQSLSENWHFELTSAGVSRIYNPTEIERSGQTGLFQVRGSFTFRGDGTDNVTIVPDDCLRSLRINGTEILELTGENWCDYQRGFTRVASKILKSGQNYVEAEIENFGGPRQFQIKITREYSWKSPLSLALYALVAIWTFLLERSLGLARISRIAFRVFTVLSLVYLLGTAPHERTFDVFEGGGHADYIKFVADKAELPEIGKGWEYHQPPLYYILSGALYELIGPFSNGVPWEIFQGMNWLIFQLFVAIGLVALRESLDGFRLSLGSFLLALWPMNLASAARIGNDALLYLFVSIAILFLMRWCKRGKVGDLICTNAYIALACFTKNTALPVVAAAGILTLLVLLRFHISKLDLVLGGLLPRIYSKKSGLIALFSLLSLVLACSTSLLPKVIHSQGDSMERFLFPGVVGNPGLDIQVSSSTFLPFGSLIGMTTPFVSAWTDSSGRQNFWTYLFKSFQSSEISTEDYYLKLLGYIYLYGSYLIITLLLLGLSKQIREGTTESLVFVCLFFSCIAALIVSTIIQPHACKQDFRYVYFLLLPIVMLVMNALPTIPNRVSRYFATVPIIITIVSGNLLMLGIALDFKSEDLLLLLGYLGVF